MSDSENEKIKRLNERAAEIAQEREKREAARRVLDFRSRAPWTPPEAAVEVIEPAPEPPGPVIDEDAIEVLEEVLREARQGHVRGVVILAGRPGSEPDLVTDIVTSISVSCVENLQIFLGGLETSKAELFDFHGDFAFEVELEEGDEE